MTIQFVVGTPADLESKLKNFNPSNRSNISLDELRKNVNGYVPEDNPTSIQYGYVSKVVYFYFPKTSSSLDIKFAGHFELFIPLEPSNYGFPDESVVKFDPVPLDLSLTQEAKKAYSSILESREMPINELLEKVGFIVNSSMDYDFAKIIQLRREKGLDISHYENLSSAQRSQSKELSGLCSDAGDLIRGLLLSLNMEPRYGFTYVKSVSPADESNTHNTTLVFDKTTGRWAVINSKSPTILYNLVPKDKLPELGKPYVSPFFE